MTIDGDCRLVYCKNYANYVGNWAMYEKRVTISAKDIEVIPALIGKL